MTALDDSISRHPAGKKRDLESEGPVAGQLALDTRPDVTADEIRNPPCGDACPFVRTCLPCRFKGGHA